MFGLGHQLRDPIELLAILQRTYLDTVHIPHVRILSLDWLWCEAPEPDQRTYRMGWFAAPSALHDASGNISLDPEVPNGPLILIRTR